MLVCQVRRNKGILVSIVGVPPSPTWLIVVNTKYLYFLLSTLCWLHAIKIGLIVLRLGNQQIMPGGQNQQVVP
jgi:hypothetical protein